MSDDRMPAEVFHLSVFLEEELHERNWTRADLARRMGDDETDHFIVDLIMDVQDPSILLDRITAVKLSLALGPSPEFFLNLYNTWRHGLLGGNHA